MFTASSRSSSRGAAIFSVQNLGRRRKNHLDFIFSVFAHFQQTDGVQVNIVVVPFKRRNPLNMTRLKQWIRVNKCLKSPAFCRSHTLRVTKYAIILSRENSGRSVGPSAIFFHIAVLGRNMNSSRMAAALPPSMPSFRRFLAMFSPLSGSMRSLSRPPSI